jgi:hypothetical protein
MRLPLLSKTSNLPSKHGLSMDYGSLSSKKQVEERIKHGLVKRGKIKNGSKLGLMLAYCKEHVR